MESENMGLALSRMDDAGEMSSWDVFGALGLYPFSPAEDNYLVTIPIFEKVKFALKNDMDFQIIKSENTRHL